MARRKPIELAEPTSLGSPQQGRGVREQLRAISATEGWEDTRNFLAVLLAAPDALSRDEVGAVLGLSMSRVTVLMAP